MIIDVRKYVVLGTQEDLDLFFERAQRKVLVQYPKRQVGNKVYGGDATHLPLKLNTSCSITLPSSPSNLMVSFPFPLVRKSVARY